MTEKPLRVCFLMDQIAGHVTNYRNLRRIVDEDPTIEATWCEIEFHRQDGTLERWGHRMRIVPTHVTGVLRGVTELRRGLSASGFDAYFCNSSVSGMFSGKLGRTPTLLDSDATPVQIDNMPAYGSPHDIWPVARLKHATATHLYDSVRRIQAWSTWAKTSFVDDYGVDQDRVSVNPPGIDLAKWELNGRPRREGVPRVLFVGGDFQRKGGGLLLQWAGAKPAGSVEVHLVTRDPVPATPNVIIHRGLTPNAPELLELYHEADVFAMPSLGECFGIATIEAMAASLPVVASDSGGTADIVDHGVNGFIVKAGDLADLSSSLDLLVEQPELRAAMASKSLELARQRFDLHTNANRTIEELRRVVAESPRRRG